MSDPDEVRPPACTQGKHLSRAPSRNCSNASTKLQNARVVGVHTVSLA